MADLRLHKAQISNGQGWPTYADRAGAGYTTKLTVGTSASSALDISSANVVRIRNAGDSSSEGDLYVVTGASDVGAPTSDNYPIPVGEITYIAVDTGDTHIRLIGSVVNMVVWYSLVG